MISVDCFEKNEQGENLQLKFLGDPYFGLRYFCAFTFVLRRQNFEICTVTHFKTVLKNK